MTKCDFEAGHKPIDKIGQLAKEVLEGKYGDGEERRRNLDWVAITFEEIEDEEAEHG